MKLEDLRLDAGVVSADGHKLGNLSRFVIDLESDRITHIVVDTGIFRREEALWKGGWGMSHDRMVPFAALDAATSDEIRLTMTAEEFRDLSVNFEEEYFVPAPDMKAGVPDTSDLARLAMSLPGEPGPYVMHQQRAIGEDKADIKHDSPVWRLKPHQKIGEVERVIFDEASGAVTALVIRRGFIFSKDVVLPLDYLVEVVAGIVRVQLSDDELDRLEEFKPED